MMDDLRSFIVNGSTTGDLSGQRDTTNNNDKCVNDTDILVTNFN